MHSDVLLPTATVCLFRLVLETSHIALGETFSNCSAYIIRIDSNIFNWITLVYDTRRCITIFCHRRSGSTGSGQDLKSCGPGFESHLVRHFSFCLLPSELFACEWLLHSLGSAYQFFAFCVAWQRTDNLFLTNSDSVFLQPAIKLLLSDKGIDHTRVVGNALLPAHNCGHNSLWHTTRELVIKERGGYPVYPWPCP